MILFHEGLPRSGKSYAAVVDHIIPALAKGRRVIAYIEGLNHEAIAPLAEITVEKCKELLIPITREDVYLIWSRDYKNSLVVIDESQNFWPDDRKPLNDEITKFITEHGHHGADILLMGQVMADVHKLWRGRVARNYYFQKRDALGKPNEYKVSIQSAVRGGRGIKFEETSNEVKEYDPKYFGTYASHELEVDNKETLADSRAVVWNHPVIKKWLPRFGVVAVIAVLYLTYLFQGGLAKQTVSDKPQASAVSPSVSQVPQQQQQMQQPQQQVRTEKPADVIEPDDYVKALNGKAKPRLVSVLKYREAYDGAVQWVESKGEVVETLTFANLAGLGWTVFVDTSGSMAVIRRGASQFVVTASGLVKGQAIK